MPLQVHMIRCGGKGSTATDLILKCKYRQFQLINLQIQSNKLKNKFKYDLFPIFSAPYTLLMIFWEGEKNMFQERVSTPRFSLWLWNKLQHVVPTGIALSRMLTFPGLTTRPNNTKIMGHCIACDWLYVALSARQITGSLSKLHESNSTQVTIWQECCC